MLSGSEIRDAAGAWATISRFAQWDGCTELRFAHVEAYLDAHLRPFSPSLVCRPCVALLGRGSAHGSLRLRASLSVQEMLTTRQPVGLAAALHLQLVRDLSAVVEAISAGDVPGDQDEVWRPPGPAPACAYMCMHVHASAVSMCNQDCRSLDLK